MERNPSFWRSVIFEATALVSATWLGYVYKLYISSQTIPFINITPGLWGVLIALSVFFLASLFHLVLIKDTGRRMVVQIVQVLCLGFFLYNESIYWLATEGFALLILLSGSWRARTELNNGLSVHFFRVSGLYYGRLVMAIALMGTIFYFPYWQQNKVIVPESAFDGLTSWSLGLVNNFYPDLRLTPESTFEEIVGAMAEDEIAKIPGGENLSEAEKQRVAEQANEAMTKQLQSQFGGISPQENESLKNFIYRLLKESLSQLETYLGQWFFFGWSILVLVLSFSIGKFYSLIMSAVAFLIYQVLLASRVFSLYTETVSKESLDF